MSRKRHALTVGIGSILVVACLAIATVLTASPIHNQLRSWKLLPEPEHLTELYFTDHTHLPATYTPGQIQTVAFTIHNMEQRTVTYQYEILQTNEVNTRKVRLAGGTLILQKNQFINPKVPITLDDLGVHSQISIILSTNEVIDYWVTKGGA